MRAGATAHHPGAIGGHPVGAQASALAPDSTGLRPFFNDHSRPSHAGRATPAAPRRPPTPADQGRPAPNPRRRTARRTASVRLIARRVLYNFCAKDRFCADADSWATAALPDHPRSRRRTIASRHLPGRVAGDDVDDPDLLRQLEGRQPLDQRGAQNAGVRYPGAVGSGPATTRACAGCRPSSSWPTPCARRWPRAAAPADLRTRQGQHSMKTGGST